MRILVIFLSLFVCLPTMVRSQAQDPGAQQDAEASREKLLKAADQLDNIQTNSEATKTSVDNMKADVTKLQADVSQLQSDNATLKQQLDDLKAAFEKAEVAHAKERQVLIDSVADLIKQAGASKTSAKKKTPSTAPTAEKTPDDTNTGPVTSSSSTSSALAPPPDAAPANPAPAPDAPPVKPQKGYYHIVASGETLTLICNAYRDQGVDVTTADIRKANGLTDKSVLKVGQKLFIPKPGT